MQAVWEVKENAHTVQALEQLCLSLIQLAMQLPQRRLCLRVLARPEVLPDLK